MLLRRLQARQARRQELERQLAERQAIVAPEPAAGLERRLRAKLADWRGLLAQNVDAAREVLRVLLVDSLRFTPLVDGARRAYAFEGSIALDRLVAGVIELPTLYWNESVSDSGGKVGTECRLRPNRA